MTHDLYLLLYCHSCNFLYGLLGVYELMKIMKRVGVQEHYHYEMEFSRHAFSSLKRLTAYFVEKEKDRQHASIRRIFFDGAVQPRARRSTGKAWQSPRLDTL